ncbi:MAG: hypothetical protein EU547_02615 [Promethearchaeota archaeon]|nr:MAG: hypothetical protein EU547_02615 [Candidatus Lokiarchaeota archaeon]
MSWAKHVSKNETGYFLYKMQVDWFFSQVQEKLAEMAHRSGIQWKKWWRVVPPRGAGDTGGLGFGEEKYSYIHIVEWK